VDQKTINALERTELGKGATGRLRTGGQIPAVLYGKLKSLPVAINEREFSTKFKVISENSIINLNVNGASHAVLVKDYQEDLLTGKITHIDFYAIEMGTVLRARVPVHLTGSSKGVKEGGILDLHLHEIEVECLPKDLPSELSLDISNLDSGHAIHVKDMVLPDGVKLVNTPDQVVVGGSHAKVEVVDEAAAEAEDAAPAAGAAPAAQAPTA
jgi:large subunit ribosomal protein L25